ncbi:hypothetical protein C436_18196 [Haloarcula marismortui ATCC 33800]|uniref:Uncharacterized protein n=1 Tax=Haloarcula marismortui ATCC 33800 TaxID=662476 RepID=M0JQH9_9EURY|nr:hypothetical protein C436_18196 [Haloarcula sinaiiensis ATCC 33800]
MRRAARAIQEEVATESVDVLAPSASQYGAWTLDAVLRDAEGVPPEVLRELALAGLTLQPMPSQAESQHMAATV